MQILIAFVILFVIFEDIKPGDNERKIAGISRYNKI